MTIALLDRFVVLFVGFSSLVLTLVLAWLLAFLIVRPGTEWQEAAGSRVHDMDQADFERGFARSDKSGQLAEERRVLGAREAHEQPSGVAHARLTGAHRAAARRRVPRRS